MTEADWLAGTDPRAMLAYIAHDPESDRELRLLLCGWCRAVWDDLVDPRSRSAVEVSERFADGAATAAELAAAEWNAEGAMFKASAAADGHDRRDQLECRLVREGWLEPSEVAGDWPAPVSPRQVGAAFLAEAAAFGYPPPGVELMGLVPPVGLLWCVFGNPFRPADAGPRWRTPAVRGVAEGVYADRAFDRLPVLADALEDAGCDHPDVLAHCRGGGEHVRGCWAVDLAVGYR